MSIFASPMTDAHIKIVRGDHLQVVVNFVNEDGNAVDLTGWVPLAKAYGKSSGNITDLTVVVGESKVTMTLTPEQTTLLDAFSKFDIQFTKTGDAERITPVAGILQMLSEVTT